MSLRLQRKRKEAPAAATKGPVAINILSADRILEIHKALVAFFAQSPEPIADLGLRDSALLERALAQPADGASADPRENAAAMVQGLFDELPFHDGNAQTALIALLLHLNENGFGFNRISFDDIYRLLVGLSEHTLDQLNSGKAKAAPRKAQTNQSELALLSKWLQEKTRQEKHQDHPLTVAELLRLLEARGYVVSPSQQGGSPVLEIARMEERIEKRILGLGTKRTSKAEPVHQIPQPEADGLIPATQIRDLRKACGLEESEFYDASAKIDSFIRQHQTLLPRLAKL